MVKRINLKKKLRPDNYALTTSFFSPTLDIPKSQDQSAALA